MTAWQPRRGERVLAVLPDGHEIEGEYHVRPVSSDERHIVNLNDSEYVAVRTVKPLPVTEPTAFGARVMDGEGRHWVRISPRNGFWWRAWDDGHLRSSGAAWSELTQPVRVIDADPDWGDK